MAPKISVSINFLKRLKLYKTEKPFRLYIGQPVDFPDAPITNVETEPRAGIELSDIRGEEELYSLETHGFRFIKHDQSFSAFTDARVVEEQYLPEVEAIIRNNVPGANKVVVFNWRLREQMEQSKRDPNILVSPLELQEPTFALAPSQMVHTAIKLTKDAQDATEYTLLKRVRKHLGEEAKELLKGRVQIINFWRPIEYTIYNWPLVLCDGRTSPVEKLIAVDQVGRRFVGDIYYAPYDPSFEWYYQSAMSKQEGVIFKNWDTSLSTQSRSVPSVKNWIGD
ncbi:hypothetical protein OQA88_1037 [Cercophora sp. LCS_1]